MKPPFYAVELHRLRRHAPFPPTGLLTDHHCRVIGWNDKPIEGLYAAGNSRRADGNRRGHAERRLECARHDPRLARRAPCRRQAERSAAKRNRTPGSVSQLIEASAVRHPDRGRSLEMK